MDPPSPLPGNVATINRPPATRHHHLSSPLSLGNTPQTRLEGLDDHQFEPEPPSPLFTAMCNLTTIDNPQTPNPKPRLRSQQARETHRNKTSSFDLNVPSEIDASINYGRHLGEPHTADPLCPTPPPTFVSTQAHSDHISFSAVQDPKPTASFVYLSRAKPESHGLISRLATYLLQARICSCANRNNWRVFHQIQVPSREARTELVTLWDV